MPLLRGKAAVSVFACCYIIKLGHVLGAVVLVLQTQLGCVAAASVSPCQVPAGLDFIVSCDCYMQQICCFVQRTGLWYMERIYGFCGVRKSA